MVTKEVIERLSKLHLDDNDILLVFRAVASAYNTAPNIADDERFFVLTALFKVFEEILLIRQATRVDIITVISEILNEDHDAEDTLDENPRRDPSKSN